MTIRSYLTVSCAAAALAALAIVVPVGAGGDKIAFPADYDKGVLFTTVDRPDNKQFREFYTSAAALAGRKGRPAAAERDRDHHGAVCGQA